METPERIILTAKIHCLSYPCSKLYDPSAIPNFQDLKKKKKKKGS
jgi:hypothetical protein